MTEDRFDQLTKLVSSSTTRRGLLKGAAAVALGGLVARVRGDVSQLVDARARVSMACARLGQPCATGPGTPGNLLCCPDLACGVDAVCCKDTNQTCVSDGDCCGSDNVCRPNPTGLGNRCLPPGAVGAACVELTDCAAELTCDPSTGQCRVAAGLPCSTNSDCVSGICDDYTGTCAGGCFADGAACVDPADCCTGYCDSYTRACTAFCTGDSGPCSANTECCSGMCDDLTGQCLASCLPTASSCVDHTDCCSSLCDAYAGMCVQADGQPCLDDSECASGLCDAYTGVCIGSCRDDGSRCLESGDCCSGVCDGYTLTCLTPCIPRFGPCYLSNESACCAGYCVNPGDGAYCA
jgi:hypothetical protein